MIAFLCIDTKSGRVRRYLPRTLMGRVWLDDEMYLEKPQESTLPAALEQFRLHGAEHFVEVVAS